MSTIFKKIIDGEIPCHKVAENERFLAFLDIRPVKPGHVLVIPKVEVDRFFDLPGEILQEILVFAQPVARAIEAVVPCNRVGLVVAGLEIAHAHLHLIPISAIEDLSFANAKPASQEELAEMARKIREALAGNLEN